MRTVGLVRRETLIHGKYQCQDGDRDRNPTVEARIRSDLVNELNWYNSFRILLLRRPETGWGSGGRKLLQCDPVPGRMKE